MIEPKRRRRSAGQRRAGVLGGPKGLPEDPATSRLAIGLRITRLRTTHSDGVIPLGQYGVGT